MPKGLIALNLFLGAVGVVFALLLVREVVFPRRVPPPPEPRAPRTAVAPVPAPPMPVRPVPEDLSAYTVIVSRSLFNAARSGATVINAGAMSPDARVFLYGVVVDGVQTRAYLSNPVTKRVSGYQVGDTVAGWQVQRIGEDRVVIASPEGGSVEVMLRDPSKPQAAPPSPGAPGSPAPAPPASAVPTPAPVIGAVPSPSPGVAAPGSPGAREELPSGVAAPSLPPPLIRPGGGRGEGK